MRRHGPMLCSTTTRLGILMLCSWWSAAALPRDILVLTSAEVPAYQETIEAFRRHGSYTLRQFELDGNQARGEKLLSEAMKQKPVLVLALGAKAAYLAARRVREVPVLFADVINWHNYGLSGKNVSGISLDVPIQSMFAQFLMTVPGLKRLGILYHPKHHEPRRQEAARVAAEYGLELVALPVEEAAAVPKVFAALAPKIDAFWMLPDQVIYTASNFSHLQQQCLQRKLPFMAFSEEFVRAGALLSISPDYRAIGMQAALMAGELLSQQAKPQGEPETRVVAPVGTTLVFNRRTAASLGLAVPPSLLQMADTLID